MKILGIDSHSNRTQAAVIEDGHICGQVLLRGYETHSENLFLAIERVLHTVSNIDAVAVAAGPGSFTGLRIGVTAAKVMAYSRKVPLVGVSTLEAIAYQIRGLAPLQAVMVDAKRSRVAASLYQLPASDTALDAKRKPLIKPGIYPVEEYIHLLKGFDDKRPVVSGGDACELYFEELSHALGDRLLKPHIYWMFLHSASIAYLGKALIESGIQHDPFKLVPEYLKRSEAEIQWELRAQS